MTVWLMRSSNHFSHKKFVLILQNIIFILLGFLFSNCDIFQYRECEYIQFPSSTVNCETLEAKEKREAKARCESLGMRLPTREEVKEAFNARVIKHGEIQGTLYWESKEAADAFLRDFPLRCIR